MVGLDLGVQGWRNIFAAPGVLLLLPSTNLPHRELWTDLLESCNLLRGQGGGLVKSTGTGGKMMLAPHSERRVETRRAE